MSIKCFENVNHPLKKLITFFPQRQLALCLNSAERVHHKADSVWVSILQTFCCDCFTLQEQVSVSQLGTDTGSKSQVFLLFSPVSTPQTHKSMNQLFHSIALWVSLRLSAPNLTSHYTVYWQTLTLGPHVFFCGELFQPSIHVNRKMNWKKKCRYRYMLWHFSALLSFHWF